ncbi:serine hydroxymethyltransferase, partial [Streptomyces sp. 13-12-16]
LGVDGRTARGRLAAAGLVLDCCALPHDDDRGLRLGTAAVTTQGMGAREMTFVAGLLASVLRGGTEPARAREDVRELAAAFPPYPR